MVKNEAKQIRLADVGRRLTDTYNEVQPEHVTAAVRDAYSRFDSSQTRDFVPPLVERRAREDLAAAKARA